MVALGRGGVSYERGTPVHPEPHTLDQVTPVKASPPKPNPASSIGYRGTSFIRNSPPPLGIGLLKGPRGRQFLRSEAPLQVTPVKASPLKPNPAAMPRTPEGG